MEIKNPKVKFSTLNSEPFNLLMQKIVNQPTQNIKAMHINHVVKEIQRHLDEGVKAYRVDIVDVFAQKDEAGKIINGPDTGNFKIIEGKEKEFAETHKKFMEREVEIKWRPLTPDTLSDVRMSAQEIELLGELLIEQNGPGVPDIVGMPGMGRAVRRAEHRV